MPRLNSNQLAYLASEWAQYASALQAYQSKMLGNPNVDQNALQDRVNEANDAAVDFANKAAAAIFNDSAAAFQSLKDVTQHANSVAAGLKAQAASYSRFAAITAGMVNLALALGSGNAVSVFKQVGALSQALANH